MGLNEDSVRVDLSGRFCLGESEWKVLSEVDGFAR